MKFLLLLQRYLRIYLIAVVIFRNVVSNDDQEVEEETVEILPKDVPSKKPIKLIQSPKDFPLPESYQIAAKQLSSYIEKLDLYQVPYLERTLVVYHVGWLTTENSFDVTINNVNIFLSSVINDCLFYNRVPGKTRRKLPKAFYWVNIIGGKTNPLYRYFAPLQSQKKTPFFNNLAIIDWEYSPADMHTHFRTLEILRDNHFLSVFDYPKNNISSIIFLNNESRGPLVSRFHNLTTASSMNRNNYQNDLYSSHWIDRFQFLLSLNENVLVGTTFSCEFKPHVQTHIFAIRSSFISTILENYGSQAYMDAKTVKDWRKTVKHYEVGLTDLVLNNPSPEKMKKNKPTVTSFLYYHRSNQTSFQGQCIKSVRSSGFRTDLNPVRWCNLQFEEIVFMKWGGNIFRQNSLVCDLLGTNMENYLPKLIRETNDYYSSLYQLMDKIDKELSNEGKLIAKEENGLPTYYFQNAMKKSENSLLIPLSLNLVQPETLRGGVFSDLFKEFDQERTRPVHPLALSPASPSSSSSSSSVPPLVCFVTTLYGNYLFQNYKFGGNEKRQNSVMNYFLESLGNEFQSFLSCE
jgi:DNA-binding ferritin-like protein (Dps family)